MPFERSQPYRESSYRRFITSAECSALSRWASLPWKGVDRREEFWGATIARITRFFSASRANRAALFVRLPFGHHYLFRNVSRHRELPGCNEKDLSSRTLRQRVRHTRRSQGDVETRNCWHRWRANEVSDSEGLLRWARVSSCNNVGGWRIA